ncbi:unnamed protein product [Candida verbasci]|uniref:RING-type E3 ubiquitin transferase n=1 Tax=Candida verbasci TaxID=1227364 RepID=A0A9W4U163_9ASCO|nr:unnamed protein product [Candida verbasci]
MFIFLSLPAGNEQPHSEKEREVLMDFQQSLLNSTNIISKLNYNDGYGNITGFQLSYKDSEEGKKAENWPFHEFNDERPFVEDEKFSILPNYVSNYIKNFWGNERNTPENAYLLNISGRADGEFKVDKEDKKIKGINLELPQYLKDYYSSIDQNPEKEVADKSINLTNGLVSISMRNRFHHENNTIIGIDLNLKDYQEIENHNFDLTGVYLPEWGSAIATSNSAKFYGSYGLSHLLMNDKNFNHVNNLILQWGNSINDRDITLDDLHSSILKSYEQCEVIMYIQLDKTKYSKEELHSIEEEISSPQGKPIPKQIPQIEVSNFIIYSPDCGILIKKNEDKSFVGKKSEVLNLEMKNVLTGILVLVSLQLFLIIRLIKHSNTPGSLSLISSKTLFLLSYQDMLIALLCLLLSTISYNLYLILASLATIAFICCGVFEMRFMVSVLSTQANERGTTWWEILRGATSAPPNDTGAIIPMTSAPEQPQVEPDIPQLPDSSYSNSIFSINLIFAIISIFMVFSSFNWRIKYRKIFEYIGLIFINSFWIPQFFRNTLKNRNHSFQWEFLIGTSLLRIIPICYFCLIESNPLRHRYDPKLAIVISTYLILQLFLLYLQFKLGARFWINEKFLPKQYDYHRIVTKSLLGELSINTDNSKAFEELTEYKTNCPICMNDDLIVPVWNKNDDKQEDLKKKLIHHKMNYMITPCNHLFHNECLESWMKYKLQCPVCRKSLPPI